MNTKNNSSQPEKFSLKTLGANVDAYIKSRKLIILILVSAYIISAVCALFNAAARDGQLILAEHSYEAGQISERDIVSSITETIPAKGDLPELQITQGEKIFRKNFPITADALRKYEYLAMHGDRFDEISFISNLIYLLLLSFVAIFLFTPPVTTTKLSPGQIIFLTAVFCVNYAISTFVSKVAFFSLPYTTGLLSIATMSVSLVTLLITPKVATFFSVILALGIFSASEFSIISLLYAIFPCIFAIRLVKNVQRRTDLFLTSIMLAIINALMTVFLMVCFPQALTSTAASVSLAFLSGFLNGSLILGLLPALEYVLNTASTFRLRELSDVNNPTMKKMLLTAPGTYNHTTMVAALAEAACDAMGARALVARVGAYYHDLGKLEHPEYFVENQSGENKHNKLNPSLSISIIRSHVKKGVEKARALHLPEEVISIINEHHGDSLIAFFYNEAKKLDPNVQKEDYSYIGTPPRSKESATVMLADTVEAACRTLDNPTPTRIEAFIHQLILAKLQDGQLENSSLTFNDLTTIEKSFAVILAGHYHSRIKYPNQKDPTEEGKEEKDASES
ncbi:MAG: HDIG domain-containing protein [Spirochaetaceae bacterium]|nr:HDIG domain-containing protein [Spirochaetaceae bacterium]